MHYLTKFIHKVTVSMKHDHCGIIIVHGSSKFIDFTSYPYTHKIRTQTIIEIMNRNTLMR